VFGLRRHFFNAGDGGASTDANRALHCGRRRLVGGDDGADVIVTATGLQMLMLEGLLTVDREPVDLGETVAYKGLMPMGSPTSPSRSATRISGC
jgi:cation diffusion facilitator CzcD-associated flavoprotein CzcO